MSAATWVIPDVINGTGLRENATYGSGAFYWAWADTRSGPIVTYLASHPALSRRAPRSSRAG